MSNNIQSYELSVQAIADGDAKAFRELYNAYWNKVYSIALYYFRCPVSAQDMVQEVFLKIWVQRKDLAQVKNLSAYINTVTRNTVIDQMRKKLLQTEALINEELEIAEKYIPEIERKEIAYYIQMAIDKLSPQQRKVYTLAKEEDLSLKEVAEKLNISYPTAREYMSLALRHIRKFLQDHLDHIYLLAILFMLN